jgi:membrane protein insertase Oxa1/YidC/SpoIIIJ
MAKIRAWSPKLDDLKKKFSAHLKDMMKEREAYRQHRHQAREHPEECISLIFDGSDQCTNLHY